METTDGGAVAAAVAGVGVEFVELTELATVLLLEFALLEGKVVINGVVIDVVVVGERPPVMTLLFDEVFAAADTEGAAPL